MHRAFGRTARQEKQAAFNADRRKLYEKIEKDKTRGVLFYV